MMRYHWHVFLFCTLGWSLGCFDWQLFVLQRISAELFLGWAVGALLFGVLGDKYGRSRMMVWTILLYSLFTGLSGLSASFWDFLLYRFLAGIGIGGQFVVAAALVAETMPERARPYALGFLHLFSLIGVPVAIFLSMGAGTDDWRIVLLIGAFPAVLVYFVMRYLDEPEKWKLAVRDKVDGYQNAGSYRELFGLVYRRRTIFATILTTTGVIGLWGIGFFSADLYQSVGRRLAEERLKAEGTLDNDFGIIAYLVLYPQIAGDTDGFDPQNLLGFEKDNSDARYLFEAIRELPARKQLITAEAVADEAVNRWNLAEGKGRQTSAVPTDEVERRRNFFLECIEWGNNRNINNDSMPTRSVAETWAWRKARLASDLQWINQRAKHIEKETASWLTTATLLMSLGAVFGTFAFTMATVRFGRRLTLTVFLAASMLAVIGVFLFADTRWEIYTLVPVKGFFLSALFAGPMIYLPELFPTRIRCTAIALCFSAGYFIAAGIYTLGSGLPVRWSGAAMSSVFLIGIAAVWMLPETKDKPLPE